MAIPSADRLIKEHGDLAPVVAGKYARNLRVPHGLRVKLRGRERSGANLKNQKKDSAQPIYQKILSLLSVLRAAFS